MNLYSDVEYDFDDTVFLTDFSESNVKANLSERQFRQLLEDKLEQKRLMEDLQDLNGEFNWNEL